MGTLRAGKHRGSSEGSLVVGPAKARAEQVGE